MKKASSKWYEEGKPDNDHPLLRDRPFNLNGGGYGLLFRSEFFFWTTQELEYLFFLSRKAQFFFSKI